MAQMQRAFPRHQHEPAPLLELDVGGARQEVAELARPADFTCVIVDATV